MNIDELNAYLAKLLATCPVRPKKGVNRWLFDTARELHRHVKL